MTVAVLPPVPLPPHSDTIVIGGGTAGAAVAGLLAERCDESVLLLEAGPDYGRRDGGRWPADLLDARALPASHDWGYDSSDLWPYRTIPFERARVIGGCSAHNGCAEIWGSRLDYDGWAALGNPGWSTDELLPYFHAGARRLRVRRPATAEVTPFHLACLRAGPGAGLPVVGDLNDLDQDVGIGLSPVNIVDGVRWNSAFAFLDPVRARRNLTVAGDVMVDRLEVRGGHAEAVRVSRDAKVTSIRAGRIVVCAGTFGSPAILLRSGIGAADELRRIGVGPRLELPGVGRNLHDHPVAVLFYEGTPGLEDAMRAFAARHWLPEEQTIGKARSSRCPSGFDLHLFPTGGPTQDGTGWNWFIPVACMTPRSRGAVTLNSADPSAAPRIDHAFLSDPDDEDLRVLVDGIELARRLAAQPSLAPLLGAERIPGPSCSGRGALTELMRPLCHHYYHPVGTCRMAPASDPTAVVDARGRIHGLDNAYVADASIMPIIPRANTNMPALVVAMRIADYLTDRA